MTVYVTPPADCQADAVATSTRTWNRVEPSANTVCQAEARAGKDLGEQVSGVNQATAVASSSEDGARGVAVATASASSTSEHHRIMADSVCQVSAVANADIFRSQTANDRWELFHSIVEGVFDWTSPVDTWLSPTSRELSAATYGAGTHYFVLRKRNKWGLSSQNIEATKIVVAAGTAAVPPPSPPLDTTIAQAPGNVARITAAYYAAQDGAAAANQWMLFVTTDGSDPALATPIVTDQGKAFRGVRRFSYDTAALSGNTVRALVKTRRRDNDGTTHDSVSSPELTFVHGLAALGSPSRVGIEPFTPTD